VAHEEAKVVENKFIKARCSEYEMPKFDYFIHAPDHE
jgi:hypothetical protein